MELPLNLKQRSAPFRCPCFMRVMVVILMFSLLAMYCRKDGNNHDCNNYRQALESQSVGKLRLLMQPIILAVGKMPDNEDGLTRNDKVKSLIKLLNEQSCDITADDQYVLIDTNPQLAELHLRINGSAETYGVDFKMEPGELLELVNLHK